MADGLAQVAEPAGWPGAVDAVLANQVTASAPARVTVVRGGPHVVTGPVAITDHLGCPVTVDANAANAADVVGRLAAVLCRCGASAVKPGCDGACVRTVFQDAKDPSRVPDRRDTHVGQQVTILDNRGICQHSGLCTDRLASVFHAGSDPFVTPSGGRLDEIVRAVRDCPSGALSYAIDHVEARDQVDWHDHRDPTVVITADGPYRVTGPVEVVDEDGTPVPRADGASGEHCSLCRCGHSQNKPFCSGMHYYVGFHDPVPDRAAVPSIFAWAGGYPGLLRMTRLFYEKLVPADELLGPLFATMSEDHPQRVAQWLGEVFGGPAAYSTAYGGYPRMLSQHRGKGLTEDQRARWVQLLTQSAREAGLPNDPEFRSAFGSYIEWGSRLAVENSQVDAAPPEHMPMPRWDWSTAAGPPGSRVAGGAPDVAEPPVVLPAAGEPVTYGDHIRTMFRERDRRSMLFAFDLWSRDDTRAHATAIHERLQAGTMPCDGAWPLERIEVFARWIAEGMA